MRNLERILVGTDFSAAADTALRSAAALARRYQAAIDLVTVVTPPTVYQRVLSPIQGHLVSVEELVAKAASDLGRAAGAAHLAELQIKRSVRVGTPFAELIAAAREGRASLIAVGTHQRRGVTHLLLGSTAERVVRKAPVPVLVARQELSPEPTCVLVPTDFSSTSQRAAEEGIALARRWIAKLVLLHVIEPIAQTYLWPLDPTSAQIFPAEPEDLTGEWESFLEPLQLRDVRWEQRTLKGEAGDVINQVAGDEAADLIVIGTHGRSGLAHALLGSLAERVIRTASRAVLTIRPDAFQFRLP